MNAASKNKTVDRMIEDGNPGLIQKAAGTAVTKQHLSRAIDLAVRSTGVNVMGGKGRATRIRVVKAVAGHLMQRSPRAIENAVARLEAENRMYRANIIRALRAVQANTIEIRG